MFSGSITVELVHGGEVVKCRYGNVGRYKSGLTRCSTYASHDQRHLSDTRLDLVFMVIARKISFHNSN